MFFPYNVSFSDLITCQIICQGPLLVYQEIFLNHLFSLILFNTFNNKPNIFYQLWKISVTKDREQIKLPLQKRAQVQSSYSFKDRRSLEPPSPQILADKLTLFQSWGQITPTSILIFPPIFSNLPTALLLQFWLLQSVQSPHHKIFQKDQNFFFLFFC